MKWEMGLLGKTGREITAEDCAETICRERSRAFPMSTNTAHDHGFSRRDSLLYPILFIEPIQKSTLFELVHKACVNQLVNLKLGHPGISGLHQPLYVI